jgi:hypothetical protein
MLTPEQIAEGWIEHVNGLPGERLDLLFATGEVSEGCNVRLAVVACGFESIIAYRPEPRP